MIVYVVLFKQKLPQRTSKKDKMEAKLAAHDEPEEPISSTPTRESLETYDQVDAAIRSAFDTGDHRAALRCWNSFKQFNRTALVHLPQVVESMQICKKDGPFIVKEIQALAKKFPDECDMTVINDLMASLGQRQDTQLMELLAGKLPSMGFKKDSQTYEAFISTYFTTRNFNDVHRLIEEMQSKQVPLTAKITVTLIKTALRTNDFNEALHYFRELKSCFTFVSDSGSQVPQHLVAQVVELACKEHHLSEFLPELEGMPLSEETLNAMLTECFRQKDIGMARSLDDLARASKESITDATRSLLIKALTADADRVRTIVEEILVREGQECTSECAFAVLGFCLKTSDFEMADKLLKHLQPRQPSVVIAFIRFYTESKQFAKACDLFEEFEQTEKGGLKMDARLERNLLHAAMQCGRTSLANRFLEAAPADVAKNITMIRNCASEGNLKGAMTVFNSLKASGVEMNSIIYNTVLDACVQCRDLKAAQAWMEQIKQSGMADVVSFNTLIKAHLLSNNINKAHELMEEMRKLDLQPNRVTFNELINAMVSAGRTARDIWHVVSEMKEAGIKTNHVTCSILLKSLNARSSEKDVMLTMELVDNMEEPMDEVLLSSVVEACVRIGKPDLLVEKLERLQGNTAVEINGSHTFGSLIKAYGHARDLEGVWRCWKDMRNRHVTPTSITVGCMVEAVVNNGDSEGAYELVQQMQNDEHCKVTVNSVIYCSLLKGFARDKKLERAWSVYQEMKQQNLELSIVACNTLVDACARVGRMDRVPQIMDDMRSHGIEPNLITYSTTMKGHCQAGDIQTALAMMEEMQRDTKLKPDEIMYNSLLDGCAQNSLVDEGLRLLEEMQSKGVCPSNFTLSVLVKMLSRARKPIDQSFNLVSEMSQKYRFKPNVHVYTNLIQACISNRQLPRAIETLEAMVKDQVQPDSRTYTIIVRACISQNKLDQAAALLRTALGVPGALPGLTSTRWAECSKLDHSLVNETLVGLATRGSSKNLASSLLEDLKLCKQKIRVDASTRQAVSSDASVPPWRMKKN